VATELHLDEARKSLDRGIELLSSGDRLRALSYVEKAHRLNPNAETRSYLGLLTALDRGRIVDGIEMCRLSVEEQPENPEFLFNYGRAMFKADHKREAMEAVRKALLHGGGDEPKKWLEEKGVRRKPFIRFLSRKNFLNKYIGLAIKYLSGN